MEFYPNFSKYGYVIELYPLFVFYHLVVSNIHGQMDYPVYENLRARCNQWNIAFL